MNKIIVFLINLIFNKKDLTVHDFNVNASREYIKNNLSYSYHLVCEEARFTKKELKRYRSILNYLPLYVLTEDVDQYADHKVLLLCNKLKTFHSRIEEFNQYLIEKEKKGISKGGVNFSFNKTFTPVKPFIMSYSTILYLGFINFIVCLSIFLMMVLVFDFDVKYFVVGCDSQKDLLEQVIKLDLPEVGILPDLYEKIPCKECLRYPDFDSYVPVLNKIIYTLYKTCFYSEAKEMDYEAFDNLLMILNAACWKLSKLHIYLESNLDSLNFTPEALTQVSREMTEVKKAIVQCWNFRHWFSEDQKALFIKTVDTHFYYSHGYNSKGVLTLDPFFKVSEWNTEWQKIFIDSLSLNKLDFYFNEILALCHKFGLDLTKLDKPMQILIQKEIVKFLIDPNLAYKITVSPDKIFSIKNGLYDSFSLYMNTQDKIEKIDWSIFSRMCYENPSISNREALNEAIKAWDSTTEFKFKMLFDLKDNKFDMVEFYNHIKQSESEFNFYKFVSVPRVQPSLESYQGWAFSDPEGLKLLFENTKLGSQSRFFNIYSLTSMSELVGLFLTASSDELSQSNGFIHELVSRYFAAKFIFIQLDYFDAQTNADFSRIDLFLQIEQTLKTLNSLNQTFLLNITTITTITICLVLFLSLIMLFIYIPTSSIVFKVVTGLAIFLGGSGLIFFLIPEYSFFGILIIIIYCSAIAILIVIAFFLLHSKLGVTSLNNIILYVFYTLSVVLVISFLFYIIDYIQSIKILVPNLVTVLDFINNSIENYITSSMNGFLSEGKLLSWNYYAKKGWGSDVWFNNKEWMNFLSFFCLNDFVQSASLNTTSIESLISENTDEILILQRLSFLIYGYSYFIILLILGILLLSVFIIIVWLLYKKEI